MKILIQKSYLTEFAPLFTNILESMFKLLQNEEIPAPNKRMAVEVFDKINVINTDFYYQNGEFTKELTEENKKLLEKFNKVQYYQMNEFKNK